MPLDLTIALPEKSTNTHSPLKRSYSNVNVINVSNEQGANGKYYPPEKVQSLQTVTNTNVASHANVNIVTDRATALAVVIPKKSRSGKLPYGLKESTKSYDLDKILYFASRIYELKNELNSSTHIPLAQAAQAVFVLPEDITIFPGSDGKYKIMYNMPHVFRKTSVYEDHKLQYYANQLKDALSWLSLSNLHHSDLHAGNVMIDKDDKVKIIDWDLLCRKGDCNEGASIGKCNGLQFPSSVQGIIGNATGTDINNCAEQLIRTLVTQQTNKKRKLQFLGGGLAHLPIASNSKVKIGNYVRTIYLGARGGKYVRWNGSFVPLANFRRLL